MIAAALLALSAPAQEAPSAGPLISQMLSRYSGAQTAQGTITTLQSAKGVTVTTRTEVALEKPAKLRISQARDGSQGGKWLAVSDGVRLSYNRPQGAMGKDRFIDAVDGGMDEVYTAFLLSIGEKSIPLDIIVGRKGDLKAFVSMLSPMTLSGTTTIGGESVQLASGKFRKGPDLPFVGTITLAITPSGDLKRLSQKETFNVPEASPDPIEVTTIYDVSVALDKPIVGQPFVVQ